MINPSSKISTVELIKKKFLWIILGVIIFYVLLILISDVEKYPNPFYKLRQNS